MPNSLIDRSLAERLRRVRLVVMDVDGTLTDGGMYYSSEGEALKRFNVRDGMGVTLLRRAGLVPAILTSDDSAIAAARARKLSIERVALGARNKSLALKELTSSLQVEFENVAYIGDDVNDEAAMRLCGVSACPADAAQAIRSAADYICEKKGGQGAVREFIELILNAQQLPITLPESF